MRWDKPALWFALALPALGLLAQALLDQLGANPAEALIRSLGDWTLRLLLLALAVTPLRQISGWQRLATWRRAIGVSVFVYASLHLCAYLWFDQGFDWSEVWRDVLKRPFIWVGLLAWLGLLALAATSFNRAVKALGAARWRRLHQLVYLVASLALVHFYWMRTGKNDHADVVWHGLVLAVLLGWRLWRYGRARREKAGAGDLGTRI